MQDTLFTDPPAGGDPDRLARMAAELLARGSDGVCGLRTLLREVRDRDPGALDREMARQCLQRLGQAPLDPRE